ncbi:MAG: protein kinase [Gemmataceae bacterium]
MSHPTNLESLEVDQWKMVHQLAIEFEEARLKNPLAKFDPYLEKAPELLRPHILVELIKTDLDISWAGGQRIYLEDYLAGYPSILNRDSIPAHLVEEEYRIRAQHDGPFPPDLADYKHRFPKQFEALQELIAETEPRHHEVSLCYQTVSEEAAEPPKPDFEEPSGSGDTKELPLVSEATPMSKSEPENTQKPQELKQSDQSVAGYRFTEKITQTATFEVWKGEAPDHKLVGLIKTKLAAIHSADGAHDPFSDLKAAQQLIHPNLLTLIDFFTTQGSASGNLSELQDSNQGDTVVVVTDPPEHTLADRLNKCREVGLKAIPVEELVYSIKQVAEALDYLISQNGRPGPLSPASVFLSNGLAHLVYLGPTAFPETKDVPFDTSKHSAYTPPEFVDGNNHRNSAQYSLAMTYVELRRGKLPFNHPSLDGLIPDYLQEDPDLVPLSVPEAQVLLRAGSKRPERRFPTCRAFAEALERAVRPTLPTSVGSISCTKKDFIGKGTFANVWEAEMPGEIPVALKVIDLDEPEKRQLALNALTLTKHLSHPYLIQVFAFTVEDRELRIVMELADKSLRDRMKECIADKLMGIPVEELLPYIEQVADALDYLHENNVIHCDIKPANLLLKNSYVKVADFDVATFLRSNFEFDRTTAGSMPYMSPEVWHGRLSKHSDQYSLAATYVELRLNRYLHEMGSLAGAQKAHCALEPDLRPLPEAEKRVLRKALSKDPEERYSSCRAFAQALRQSFITGVDEENTTTSTPARAKVGSHPNDTKHRVTDDTLHSERDEIPATDVNPSDLLDSFSSDLSDQARPEIPSEPPMPPSGTPRSRSPGWPRRIIPAIFLVVLVGVIVGFFLFSGTPSPTKVGVTFRWKPKEAVLWIDDELGPQKSPANFELSPGSHAVVLKLGSRSLKREIIVNKSQTEFELEFPPEANGTEALGGKQRPTYRVSFSTNPPAANIILEGHPKKQTPATFQLRSGTYAVRIEREGYSPIKETIVVNDGSKELDYRLDPIKQVLRVSSVPPGATVLIDNKDRGQALEHKPLEITLPIGTYTIALRLRGHKTWKQEVTIDGNEPLVITQSMEKREGRQYAFLVGVRQSANFGQLKLPAFLHAETDLEELSQTLLARQFQSEYVTLLTGNRPPEYRATTDNILGHLKTITQECAPQDKLVVAFAGYQVSGRLGAKDSFVAVDGIVPLDTIYKHIRDCEAGSKLVLLDGWQHPWAKKQQAPLPLSSHLVTSVPPVLPKTFVISACAAGQESHPRLDSPHGVFFDFVNKGLQGACDSPDDPSKKDGIITYKELSDYLESEISKYVRLTYGRNQIPHIVGGENALGTESIGNRSTAFEKYLQAHALIREALATVDEFLTEELNAQAVAKVKTALDQSDKAIQLIEPVDGRLEQLRPKEFTPVYLALARAYCLRATTRRLLGQVKEDLVGADLMRAETVCLKGRNHAKNNVAFPVLLGNILAEKIRMKKLGMGAIDQDLAAQASKAFQSAQQLEPHYPWTYYYRGLLLRTLSDHLKAGEAYRQAIDTLIPKKPNELTNFANGSDLALEGLSGCYARLYRSYVNLATAAVQDWRGAPPGAKQAAAQKAISYLIRAKEIAEEALPVDPKRFEPRRDETAKGIPEWKRKLSLR